MAGDADAAETERDSREFASRREALEFSLHGRRGLSPGARGWLAGVAGGLIVCVIGGAALWMGQFRRQRLPVSGTANRPTPELDRSLGAMAELQRQREADQAQLLASQQAALRFLHSRTSAEALPWTSARPSDEAGWQGVPFPADRLAVRPDERLQLLKWRRTADDDEPMSLWRWGSDEHSLVVWVEATARGPAVRWDAWRQHQQGLLAAFAATPGAPQGSYFVRLSLKPGVGADSAGSLGPLVASSPFGGADRCEFELHIDPSDPRAGEWSTALSPTKPREFLAVLLWKEAGGGTAPQPWIRRGPAATAPQPPPLAQAPPGTE